MHSFVQGLIDKETEGKVMRAFTALKLGKAACGSKAKHVVAVGRF